MNNDILPPSRPQTPSGEAPAELPPASPDASLPSQQPQPDEPSRQPRRGKKPLLIGSLSLFIGGLLLLGMGWLWYATSLRAVAPDSDEMVKVTVVPGTDPTGIATLLKDNGLIRSEGAFLWYVRLQGVAGSLQSGVYRLAKADDVPTLVGHLTSGKTDTFSITFLPGNTLSKHRQVLLDAGYEEEAVDAALNKRYEGRLFAGKPASANLEGYIYGETYNFAADATPEQILQRTFDQLQSVIDENELVEKYKRKGFSLYEGITLASIIQREERDAKNQTRVSQVFLLRLKKDMPLGSDPTYQYAADKQGVPRDPGIDSPYNTRRVSGLPPGPIASPGETALIAVATPAEGDYLYFLSGDDDAMYFGRTLEEHERNIREHCQKKCQIL